MYLLLENKNDNSHFMENSGLELLFPGEKWNRKNLYSGEAVTMTSL